MHYDYNSPEAVPAFDPCPRVCIWSHRADRGSIPPRWGDDPGSRAGPARGFAAVRGVGRLCLSGRLRTAQEASKRGMGAEPPCKPRPCSQEAACSRLMAVTQRRRPPRLADLPHDQRQRPGGVRRQASQRRTTTGDRIAEARASTGLTHPMHQAHRRRRAPGRPPPPAQDPPAGRPSASKEAGHGKANRPALTRVSCNHESRCHLRVSLVV